MRAVRWAGLMTAAMVLLGGCAGMQQAVKQPELKLSDARVKSVSLADMQLEFDVKVKNPNPIGLSMKGLSYNLQLQDKPLFNGALQDRLQIDAKGTSTVKLPFNLRYEDVFGTLLALRDHKELRYTISGDADFGLITLPYSKSGTIALPSLPEISIENLSINKMGLSGVELALALNVGNANNFPIRLNGLDYNLNLAGSSLIKGASATPLSVDANHKGRMVLNMSLNYGQITSILQTLRNGSSMPIEFNSQIKLPSLDGETAMPYNWKGAVPLSR